MTKRQIEFQIRLNNSNKVYYSPWKHWIRWKRLSKCGSTAMCLKYRGRNKYTVDNDNKIGIFHKLINP